MALSIRAKTVVKLQSDTVTMDLEVNKGLPLTSLIISLVDLIRDPVELDKVQRNLTRVREAVTE
jgi:hypothetical protein